MKTDFYFSIVDMITYVTMAKNIDALKQEIAELKEQVSQLKTEFTEFKQTIVETEVSGKSVKTKKPKAEKTKAEKPKVEKAKKNCPKFTEKIKTEFTENIGELYPADPKEQKALIESFKKYADAIPADEYSTVEFSTHVANFKATLDTDEGKPMVVGGTLKVMTHSDLIDVQDEVKETAEIGIYLLDGMQVTGPPRDDDKEDLNTKSFKGKDYDVDEATGRVYDTDTEEFLGYARIKSKKFDGLICKK